MNNKENKKARRKYKNKQYIHTETKLREISLFKSVYEMHSNMRNHQASNKDLRIKPPASPTKLVMVSVY